MQLGILDLTGFKNYVAISLQRAVHIVICIYPGEWVDIDGGVCNCH